MLLRPHTTSVMIEYTVVGDDALQAFDVEIGALLEKFRAIRTTAKVHVVVANLQAGRPRRRFLRQTGWADNQVFGFQKISVRISDEQISACLTAKVLLFTVMAVTN